MSFSRKWQIQLSMSLWRALLLPPQDPPDSLNAAAAKYPVAEVLNVADSVGVPELTTALL